MEGESRVRILECAFLVPVVRNSDKRPHQPIVHRALQDALYSRFDGSTGPEPNHGVLFRAVRPVKGEYRGEGDARIEDESVRYLVAVVEDRVDELRELLARAAISLDQEAMYLSVAGVVEFVGPHPSGEGLE